MWPVSDEKGHVRGAAVRVPLTTGLVVALVRVQPTAAETLVVRTGGGDRPRRSAAAAAGYSVHHASSSSIPHRWFTNEKLHDHPHHRRSLAVVWRTIFGRWLLGLLGLWFCIAVATASMATHQRDKNHQQQRRHHPTKHSSSSGNDRAPSSSSSPLSLGLRLMLLDDNSMATQRGDNDPQQPPALFCHPEEGEQMRRMLWKAIGQPIIRDSNNFNNNNHIRTRRRIATNNENNNNNDNKAGNALECAEFCHGKSHCFVGHVMCPGWQREASSATAGIGQQESLVSSNFSSSSNSIEDGIQLHPETILAAVSRGRFLATKRVISGAMKLQCKNAVDALLTDLKDYAVQAFSAPCQRLLQRQVSVACFVL